MVDAGMSCRRARTQLLLFNMSFYSYKQSRPLSHLQLRAFCFACHADAPPRGRRLVRCWAWSLAPPLFSQVPWLRQSVGCHPAFRDAAGLVCGCSRATAWAAGRQTSQFSPVTAAWRRRAFVRSPVPSGSPALGYASLFVLVSCPVCSRLAGPGRDAVTKERRDASLAGAFPSRPALQLASCVLPCPGGAGQERRVGSVAVEGRFLSQ